MLLRELHSGPWERLATARFVSIQYSFPLFAAESQKECLTGKTPDSVRFIQVAKGGGLLKALLVLQSPKVLEELVKSGFLQFSASASWLCREPEALRPQNGFNLLIEAE